MALPSTLVFVFNLLSGIVALLISYYAFRFSRLLESGLLKSVSLGFGLLGVGLVSEAGISVLLALNLAELFVTKAVAIAESAIFVILQLLAYVIFAVGYALGAYGKPKNVAAVTPGLCSLSTLAVARVREELIAFYRFVLVSEFLAVLLLAFVVFQGILVYSRSRNNFSLTVLVGFMLILVSHIIRLGSIAALSSALYVDGTLVQFFGFVSLLVFLIRSGRIGST